MQIRKANMSDIPPLLALINRYASDGVMLPRTEFEMAENIRDFTVVTDKEHLLACGALHFYTPTAAEVRSVAVDPRSQGTGLGRNLVQALEAESRECALETLFAFTYVPGFFRKLGYQEVDRSILPLKAWRDCMRCPKFQCCDELAMVKYLHDPQTATEAIQREISAERRDPEVRLIQLPMLKQ